MNWIGLIAIESVNDAFYNFFLAAHIIDDYVGIIFQCDPIGSIRSNVGLIQVLWYVTVM